MSAHKAPVQIRALALLFTLLPSHALAQQSELIRLAYPDPPGIQENFFGRTLARSADWIFVGDYAAHDPFPASLAGAVYAYHQSDTGWQLSQALTGEVSSAYGQTISCDGSSLVVGSPGWDAVSGNPTDDTGKVSIYELQGGSWVLAQELIPPITPCLTPRFGSALAVSGDVLAIRLRVCSGGSNRDPEVWIYERGPTGWALANELRMSVSANNPSQPLGELGVSLAIDDDLVVAGSFGAYGSAVVFRRGAQGWRRSALLVDPAVTYGDFQGNAVAIDQDTVVVGAPAELPTVTGGPHRGGSAIVYERTGLDSWDLVQRLEPSDPLAGGLDFGGRFGSAVDVEGDEIAVGSRSAAHGGLSPGAVYYFRKGPAGWPAFETAKFVSSELRDGDSVGEVVRLEGGAVITTAVDLQNLDIAGEAVLVFRHQLGNAFCDALPNSSQKTSVLTIHGRDEASLGRADFFVRSLPPGTIGGLAASLGRTQGRLVFNGNLCLGAPILRLTGRLVVADADGRASGQIDTGRLGGAWIPGGTVYLQYWHEDVVGLGLSNAVELALH